jgi:hypothetical protein
MDKNPQSTNIYNFIDNQLMFLLFRSAKNPNTKIHVSKVINMILILESLIPQTVIDGDEMVKYFSKKKPEA